LVEIIDISPPLDERTAVWPGDEKLGRNVSMSFSNGDNLELSSITTTVHIGAHADAPSHFGAGAKPIGEVALDPYLGPCCVVHQLTGPVITVATAERALHNNVPRVLIRTYQQLPRYDAFDEHFTAFTPEAVARLGEAGVKLVGLDTPSVDLFSSKDLPSHQQLLRYNMANLEGLNLNGVDEGVYELIALPLKLMRCDASPVRAILRR
jgi:arylformamidase